MLPTGHKSAVVSISLSPDEKLMASANYEGYIRIWDIASTKELRTIDNQASISAIAFSPNGKYIASGGISKGVKLWEVTTGKQMYHLRDFDSRSIEFSPDGSELCLGTTDNMAVIVDANTGETIRKLEGGHTDDVYSVAYSPDGESIISGGEDKTVILWDVKTGDLLKRFEGHSKKIGSVRFSPDGKYALSADRIYHDIILWDVAKQKEKFRVSHEYIRDVQFDVDGQYFWSVGRSGIKKWSFKDGALISDFAWDGNNTKAFQMMPDGKRMLVGSFKSTQLISTIDGAAIREFEGQINTISEIFIKEDGEEAVIFCGATNSVQRYNLKTGALIGAIKIYHDESVRSTALSPMTNNDPNGGKYFASGSMGKRIKIWETKTGRLIHTLEGHTHWVKGLTFSPDGKQLFSAGDKTVKLWDVSTGKLLKSIGVDSYSSEKVMFSPDGQLLFASTADNDIKVWDRVTGKEKYSITSQKKDIIDIKLSPACPEDPKGGKYLITACLSGVSVWNAKTGDKISDVPASVYRTGFIDFAPNHKDLLVATGKTIRQFDLATGNKINEYRTDWTIRNAAFSPITGYGILTTDEDYFARIIDLTTWTEKASFISFKNAKDWLYVTPDNYYYGTKEAAKNVHYVQAGDIYAFDQFDLQYNRPDLILQRIGYASNNLVSAYKGAYLKRLKKIGFTDSKINKIEAGEFDRNLNAPEINIADQYRYVETPNELFDFTVRVMDAKGTIDKLFISVNGVPYYGKEGKKLNHTGGSLDCTVSDLKLSNGTNIISCYVLNDAGVASLTQKIEVNYTGKPKPSELHVITIGVSKYKDAEMNLDYAAKDAKDIAKLFSQQKDKYEHINIYSFLDEGATAFNILAVKNKLLQSNVDDHVVLFVAGHGLLDVNLDYYIATHDVNFASPTGKGLRYEDLEGLLDDIPARNKLMMIDACHSGEVDKEERVLTASTLSATTGVKSRGFKNKTPQKIGLAESFGLMQKLFNDLRIGNGAVVISAASGMEFSLESSEWNNGVFTYSLLEGLKTAKADIDANQKVVVSELQDYVFKRVTELTNGKQHPTSRRENLEHDFVVW